MIPKTQMMNLIWVKSETRYFTAFCFLLSSLCLFSAQWHVTSGTIVYDGLAAESKTENRDIITHPEDSSGELFISDGILVSGLQNIYSKTNKSKYVISNPKNSCPFIHVFNKTLVTGLENYATTEYIESGNEMIRVKSSIEKKAERKTTPIIAEKQKPETNTTITVFESFPSDKKITGSYREKQPFTITNTYSNNLLLSKVKETAIPVHFHEVKINNHYISLILIKDNFYKKGDIRGSPSV